MMDMAGWLRLLVGATLVAACSLDSGGSKDGDAAAASGSGAGASGSTASGTTGPAGGSTASTSSTGTASSSSSAGQGGGGGSSPTGGAGGVIAQCTDPNGVCCGAAFCDLASSVCCAVQVAMTMECLPSSTTCAPDATQMVCDDSGDCPRGQLCCATWNGAVYTALSCKATCESPGPGPTPGDFVQCIVGTLCPFGQVCNPDTSHFGPPHGYCNPP
jgi:hypothetical protein